MFLKKSFLLNVFIITQKNTAHLFGKYRSFENKIVPLKKNMPHVGGTTKPGNETLLPPAIDTAVFTH